MADPWERRPIFSISWPPQKSSHMLVRQDTVATRYYYTLAIWGEDAISPTFKLAVNFAAGAVFYFTIDKPHSWGWNKKPCWAVAKELTMYMGLKGSTQVIPFEAKQFSSYLRNQKVWSGTWNNPLLFLHIKLNHQESFFIYLFILILYIYI